MAISNAMHIVCAVDSAYARHCAVLLRSLRQWHPEHRLEVTLLHTGIDPKEALQLYADGQSQVDALSLIQVDPALLAGFPVDGHITPAAYLRLVLGAVLPADLRRVLYLDCDILVRRPLDELWTIDLQGRVLAAVAAPNESDNCHRLRLDPEQGYFNSGVLLIDLCRYRAFGIHDQGLQFVRSHPERIRWHDQDVLNHLLRDQWLPVSDCWNATTPWWLQSGDALRADLDPHAPDRHLPFVPALIHFTGGGWYKPWNFLCLHPHRHAYRELARQTPWRHIPLLERPHLLQSWRRRLRWRQRLKQLLAYRPTHPFNGWVLQR